MLVFGPPTIADVADAEIDGFVSQYDNLFRMFTGCVDLLAMANALDADDLRDYKIASRERRRRQKLSAISTQPSA